MFSWQIMIEITKAILLSISAKIIKSGDRNTAYVCLR